MPEERKPSRGRGAGRHHGTGHHGWSPDADERRQEENPSARRSFHTEETAPSRGAGRKHVEEERTPVPGDVARPKDESSLAGADPDDSHIGRRPG